MLCAWSETSGNLCDLAVEQPDSSLTALDQTIPAPRRLDVQVSCRRITRFHHTTSVRRYSCVEGGMFLLLFSNHVDPQPIKKPQKKPKRRSSETPPPTTYKGNVDNFSNWILPLKGCLKKACLQKKKIYQTDWNFSYFPGGHRFYINFSKQINRGRGTFLAGAAFLFLLVSGTSKTWHSAAQQWPCSAKKENIYISCFLHHHWFICLVFFFDITSEYTAALSQISPECAESAGDVTPAENKEPNIQVWRIVSSEFRVFAKGKNKSVEREDESITL